ncbi:dienelactone hydrolase family protein [uncultured Microbulbifer sp.]|uniref:dienelactone hydrolase family protein n=1 Tax=uncultured Microbulbifer sp. TaxID=348147 RepID=UPI00260C5384|nr:dienelactone hydrolase family protein [uncultured Microbulbifer sp.]
MISDIWGLTEALEQLCSRVSIDHKILDPYLGRRMNFESEGAAYQYFMREGGVDNYYSFVNKYIRAQGHKCNVVGFSVGATVAWMLACRDSSAFIEQTACFYGSRVRHFLDERPGKNVDFFLADEEPSLNISDFSRNLSKIPLVNVHQTLFPHGFMNRYSSNFSPDAYNRYCDWLRVWLQNRPKWATK